MESGGGSTAPSEAASVIGDMSFAVDSQAPSNGSDTLLPVAVDTLCPNTTLGFDLYTQRDPDEPPTLYRPRGELFDQDDLQQLLGRGIRTLYVTSTDQADYRRYLSSEVMQNQEVPAPERYRVLKEANRAIFEATLRSGTVNQVVQFTSEMGSHVAGIVSNQETVLEDLFSLMEHDYYTYTHALNVCTYCLALAGSLGIRQQPDLAAIAMGALLHDIGKRQIEFKLLNRTGPLSSKQRQIIRQHPQKGFEELCLRQDLGWGELMMVYSHHERVGGRGYPVGLVGEEIHPWARICAIADVFDALTSDRPYHRADRIEAALSFLGERAGTHFDKDMVQCWIATTRCCC